MTNERWSNMEIRHYVDGKCILSYDDDVFSTDEDRTNFREMFVFPVAEKVYEKYYEKQLVQQVLERTLKNNDTIYITYCDIKTLIKNEAMSVEYIQSDEDTLLKKLMREKLNSDEYANFEKLLNEAGNSAWKEQIDFLGSGDGMIEHIWSEFGTDKRKFSV
jgi:hypothetical protein